MLLQMCSFVVIGTCSGLVVLCHAILLQEVEYTCCSTRAVISVGRSSSDSSSRSSRLQQL
jgi:hypothetical protein